jgi:hypothetical protein
LGEAVRHRTNRYLNNALSRINAASRAADSPCAASNALAPLVGSVEVTTNSEISCAAVHTATNMFPPITADCTSRSLTAISILKAA